MTTTGRLRASIRSVEPGSGAVRLTLACGPTFDVALRAYPRLVSATPEQLRRWELVDEGCGVVWPELCPPSQFGMMNAWDLLWERRCNEALGRLKAAGWTYDALDADDRDVVALWRMEADINNGGFLQFFGNWADPTCARALAALDALGATAMCSILKQMRAVLDRLEQSPETIGLDALARHLTEAEHAELQRLDEAFWKYPDRLSKLAATRWCFAPDAD